jgi:predicted nucleic-acid-binding Zn-ribbon protein
MRETQTCPKCSGKRLAVSELRDQEGRTIPAIAIIGGWQMVSEFRGTLENWFCLRCGYAELYVRNCGQLDAIAEEHPKQLRIVDAEPPKKGPYR